MESLHGTTTATATATATDPYGSATRIDARERRRMDEQFVLHTQPTLARAICTLGGPAGVRLLDAGSGYGAVACAFGPGARPPGAIVLLDSNAELLRLARQRLHAAGLPVQAQLGGIDARPLPANASDHDLVLLSFTAAHLLDLESGMANAARAVRAGGLVVVVDVDYPASFAIGCTAAAEALSLVQRKLVVQDLGARLPRAAAAGGLVPHPDTGCYDHWQAYHGIKGVRDVGLGFIGNFHATDDAVAPWRRIAPTARLYLRRLAHIYSRPANT